MCALHFTDYAMISTSKPNITLSQRIWAHIEIADPVTWISPTMMAFCGAIASAAQPQGFTWNDPRAIALAALGALMTGPLCTGFSQSINDYFDRDLDTINDPGRPIPSGRLSLRAARINWIVLALTTVLVSFVFLNPFITLLSVFGLILSAVYSVPPIKLKKHYWLGPSAVGVGYVSMSWIAGHLIFAPITWQSILAAWINGGLATGLIFLNDIKSVEGDRQHGMKSLAVALGLKKTLLVSYGLIGFLELLFLILALIWGHPWIAAFVFVGLVVPIYSQIKLYQEPTHKNFLRYLVASNPFIASIQVLSAFVVGGYFG